MFKQLRKNVQTVFCCFITKCSTNHGKRYGAYNENQVNPNKMHYGHLSNQHPSHFSSQWCSDNWREYKNKIPTPSSDKRHSDWKATLNAFHVGCKLHWSYDCPYIGSTRNKQDVNQRQLCICSQHSADESTKVGKQWSHIFG